MQKSLSPIVLMLIITFFGFGIIIPILPELVSPVHLGMMLAVYSAASFVMSPVWGGWSDRIGRKPVLLIGLIGFSISFLIFGFFIDNLVFMYVSRILGGLFSGAVVSCAVAYVADVTTEDERTKGMGLVGMSIGLGFIFGPAVGGLLTVFGERIPFFVSAALALLLFGYTFRALRESLDPERLARRNVRRVSRWMAFTGPVKYMYILGFVVSFTLAGLEAVLLYFLMARFGAGPVDFGFMLLISGVTGAVIQGGIVRRFINKGEEGRYIGIGLVLSGLGFLLLLLTSNFATGAIYLCVFAAGNALLRPCVTSMITQKTTVEQGVATGLSSSMDSLGRIAGPLSASGLYAIRPEMPFIAGAVLCLAALYLLQRFLATDRERSPVGAG